MKLHQNSIQLSSVASYSDILSNENITNEVKIAIVSSKLSLSDDDKEVLEELCSKQIEWKNFFEYCVEHRVYPLVFKNLLNLSAISIPVPIKTDMRKSMLELTRTNMLMMQSLVECLTNLAKQEIDCISFKGPIFSVLTNGDVVSRSFCDLDLLVARKDIWATVCELQRQGYQPLFSLNHDQLVQLAKTENEYPFVHEETGVSIDLQWELTGGYYKKLLFFEDIDKNSEMVPLHNQLCHVFGHEDMILYLCIHGNHHVWLQLDHICCLAQYIRKNPGIDWNSVATKAQNLDANISLHLGVLLSIILYDVTIPGEFISAVRRDKKALELCQQLLKRLLSYQYSHKISNIDRRFTLYHINCLDTFSRKARYLVRLLFYPTRYDWQLRPLPAKFHWLLFVLRPFRLLLATISSKLE